MRASPIVLAALLPLSCAGRAPAAGGAAATGDERGLACEREMPPARDIETYAGGPRPVDLAGAPAGAAEVLAHSLDREPIVRVVREHRAALRACYQEGLLRDPDLEGTIHVRWTIEPGGAVTRVALSETSLADACVVRCVLEEVATWTFPGFRSIRAGFTITYPFRFVSHGAAA